MYLARVRFLRTEIARPAVVTSPRKIAMSTGHHRRLTCPRLHLRRVVRGKVPRDLNFGYVGQPVHRVSL